jgi:hypothetical protein
MEIVIKIPKEFENHFYSDRFEDSLARVASDIESFGFELAGRYEKETIIMLRKALKDSVIIPKGHGRLGDLDMLEKEVVNGIKAGLYEKGYEEYGHINDMDDCVECIKCADTIIVADKAESEE